MNFFNIRKLFLLISLTAAFLIVISCSGDDDDNGSTNEPTGTTEVVINEIKTNIPEDEHSMQFIELRGPEGAVMGNLTFMVLEGDNDQNPGNIDYLIRLKDVTIGANGLVMIKNADRYNDDVPAETTVINDPVIRTYTDDDHEDGIIEHDTVTFVLVKTDNETLAAGDDLDANDDGVLELPAGSEIIDSVGWLYGGDGIAYTDVLLSQSASDPDALTRFYDDLAPNSVDAWANGDIFEDPANEDEELPFENRYDQAEASINLPPSATVTPGEHNFTKAPFVVLNEIVTDTPSMDGSKEYFEVVANAGQTMENIYFTVISGTSKGITAYVKNLTGYSAGENGLLAVMNTSEYTEYSTTTTVINETLFSGAGVLPNTGVTALLIYSPETAIEAGADLDANDDGKLDLPAKAQILDSIAWTDSASDIIYGSRLTNEDENGIDAQAASRYMDNRGSGASSWTYGLLLAENEMAYDPDNSKNVPEEAELTPGWINVAEMAAHQVSPVLETARTTQIPPDADDPSFWHNDADPLKSLVIATQKEAGYSIYDVNGATLADVKPGDIRYNNVDIIYGFTLGGNTVDLAVFTDRMYDRFAIYTISAEAPYLTDVTDAASPALFGGDPGDDTAYGLAVYESPSTGKFYAFATQAGTWFVKQFELAETGGKIGWTLVRTISLEAGDDDEQAEGMVVDQEYGIAYICQEEGGVYKVTAEPAGDIALGEDDMLAEEGDYNLVEDIEGVGMYYKSDGTGYVIVSSQGSNTFGVFDRVSGDFINSFSVIDNGEGVDGSQDCDGLDIMNMPFGTLFPSGIIIVQDGQDYNHDTNDYSTNFKWIKWDDVAAELGLDTDTAYDPRNPVNRID